MEITLNSEQVSYLKSLDSKKNQRKFLLDCLVESIIGESVKFEDFCVEITDENRDVLEKVWNKFHNDMDGVLDNNYLHSNSLHSKCFSSNVSTDNEIEVDIVSTKEFLKLIGKSDLIKTTKISDLPIKIHPKEMDWTTTTTPRTFMSSGNHFQDSIELGLKGLSAIKEAYEKRDGRNKKEELLKFDKLVSLEDIIKSKLLVRGFKDKTLLNNRGLIGATIEEAVNEIKKSYESANSENALNFDSHTLDEENHLCWIYNRLILKHKENPLFDYMHKLREIAVGYNSKKKYTEEDMQIAFYRGRAIEKKEKLVNDGINLPYYTDISFKEWLADYLEALKND